MLPRRSADVTGTSRQGRSRRDDLDPEAEATSARLEAILEGSDDAIVGESLDGTVLAWNRAAERLYGYREDEIVGRPISLLVPPDRRAELDVALAAIGRGQRVGALDTVRLRKDGSQVDVSVTFSPIARGDGRILGASVIARDVSRQRRAEAALRRRDAILRSVADLTQHLLSSPTWEDRIEEFLGRLALAAETGLVAVLENRVEDDAEDVLVAVRHEWLAPGVPSLRERLGTVPYRAAGFERWMETLAGDGIIAGRVDELEESERPLVSSLGIRSLAVVPIFVRGSWWGYMGFADVEVDRTWSPAEIDALRTVADSLGAAIGRQRADEALGWAEERHRTLIEQLPAITYVDDHFGGSGGLVYLSPQAGTILGYPPEEWMGDPDFWQTLLHPDDRDRVVQIDRRAREDNAPFEAVYRMIARDGRTVWFHDRYTILKDENGDPRLAHGVMLDITERMEAEETLRRREAIVEALAFAADRLLREQGWEAGIQEVLAHVGAAAGAERASIVEVIGESGRRRGFTAFEWCASGFPRAIDTLQDVDLEGPGMRWIERLASGEAFWVEASTAPEEERQAAERSGVRSVAVVPLFAGERWWGFATFGDFSRVRPWTQPEIDALRAVADAIGAAIDRGETLAALERSEQDFRSLAENAPDLIVRFDDELRVVYANPAVAQLGYHAQEVTGSAVHELDLPGEPPADFDWRETVHRWRGLMREVIRTGKGATAEFDFPAPRGLVTVECRMIPEAGPDGEVETVLLLAHDITARLRTERELRERMKEITCMLAVAHDVQAGLEPQELCVRAARHLQEAMQYPELTEATVRIDGTVGATGTVTETAERLEVPIRTDGGERGWICVCYREPRGFVPEEHILAETVADALGSWLEHREVEAALVQSEERFRRLAEGAPDLIYRYRVLPTPGFEYVSPVATEMTGYSPEEHYADPELGFKLVHPDDLPLLQSQLTLRPGEVGEPVRLRWIRRDGSILWTEQRNVGIFDEEGRLVALEGIARDVTDRIQAEERLHASLEALRVSDEQRRSLLARLVRAQEEERQHIANDIHDDSIQVLTTVGMRLAILRAEVAGRAAEEALAKAEETVRLATQRLRHLLFGLHPPSLDDAGLAVALRDHLRLLEEEPDHPELSLEDRLQVEPPPSSRTILYRLAQEALTNARKHARASHVRIVLEPDRDGVRLRVEDDGVGFDPARARDLPGHLGLSSMIDRAHLAGGWCRLHSEPGRGTSVECWVPLIPAPSAAAERGGPPDV